MSVSIIDALIEAPRAQAAAALRAELMAASEANARAVLTPREPGGLPYELRLAFAARMATLNGDERLAAHYRAMAASPLPDPAGDARLAAMQRHVDLVTQTPQAATRDSIAFLLAAGVAEADIVRLSQLIGFVNYQLRLLAGLGLIGAAA